MPSRRRWTPAALLILAGSAHVLGASPFPASIQLSSLNGADGFVLLGLISSQILSRFDSLYQLALRFLDSFGRV